MIKRYILLFSIISTAAIAHTNEHFFEGNALLVQKDPSMKGITFTLAQPNHFVPEEVLNTYKSILRNNIEQLIEENDHTIDLILKQLPTDGFWDYLAMTMQEKPLSMLFECNGPSCSLNRSLYPHARDQAQKTILQLLRKYHPDKQQKLIYTSFCAGELLTDAKILDELVQEGYTSIHINIIDLMYEGYIERVLVAPDFLPWKMSSRKFEDLNRINFNEQKNIILFTLRIHQLLTVLNTYQNNISVTLYAHVDDYLKDCTLHNNLKTDIFVGIDSILTSFNAQSYAHDDLKKAQAEHMATQTVFPEEEQKQLLAELIKKHTEECAQEAKIVEQDFIKLYTHGLKPFAAGIQLTQNKDIPHSSIFTTYEPEEPKFTNLGTWIVDHTLGTLFQYVTKIIHRV